MNNVRHVVRLRDDRVFCLPAGSARRFQPRLCPPRAETGAVAVIFVLLVLVMVGIFGLAIDLGRLYNRRIEMQTLADGVALAAARQLNGTAQGVTNAISRANAAAGKIKYDYNHSDIIWSESAIQFSASPGSNGPWLSADAAFGTPQNLFYVRVKTSDLPTPQDTIQTSFIRVLPSAPTTARASAQAIAGPSRISVTPFAICAMSPNMAEARLNLASAGPPAAPANTELVQYGFRRGVGYDLMQLNLGNTTPRTFLVNPVAPPGTVGMPADLTDARVGPFLCAGTMAMPRVTGGQITVTSPFPLLTLFDRFNSRFDQYGTGNCDPWTAPPDTNVRSYDRTVAANVPWMTPTAGPQVALSTTAGGKLSTVADQLPTNTAAAASEYGVLWSFAKAVPFASYVTGQPEPAGGYTTFTIANWNTLYDPFRPAPATGSAGAQVSGTSTPYANGVNQFPSPARFPGVRLRRVLNVPLLLCPVGGSSATVLGIGRFFMTMPATNTKLNAEFAGLASESALAITLELHP